jgi:hypothetical protein
MMMDTDHLDALNLRLSNERMRLADAKTPYERQLRAAWVASAEREIAGELAFLGQTEQARIAEIETSDEELLRELGL